MTLAICTIAFLPARSFAASSLSGPMTVTPEPNTTTPLRLPDAGLQSRAFAGARADHLPRANVLYTRFTWKDWGRLGENKIGHFKGWMDQKRFIGFRMYCNTVKDLPEGLSVPSHDAGDRHSPLYWSDEYIKAHRELVQAVAKQLADHPYLAFIDIGGVGNTGGEWLVYPDDRWGAKPSFINAGYTAEARDKVLWETIKMYREAFPHVRLYLATAGEKNAKDKTKLREYMKKNNIGFRLDGLCGETVDKKSWQYRSKIHEVWKEHPFQWEGAFSTMEWEKDNANWSTATIMDAGLTFGPAMFTYADNDQDAARFEQNPEKAAILSKVAMRLGYRISFSQVKYPGTVRSGSRFRMALAVTNRGCSRMYSDRQIEVSFLGSDGRARAVVRAKPNPPTGQWMPGENQWATLDVALPKGAPGGTYMLALAMMDEDPRRPGQRIEMAMEKKTADGRYLIDRIAVRSGGGGAVASRGASGESAQEIGGLAGLRKIASGGDLKGAAAKAREQAGKAKNGSKSSLESMAAGFEAVGPLRKIVIGRHATMRQTIYVDFGGRATRAKLIRADADGIVASVRGAEIPMAWDRITPVRFCGIASKFLNEDAAEHLMLARFAAAMGLADRADGAITKVLSLDSSRQNDVLALRKLID